MATNGTNSNETDYEYYFDIYEKVSIWSAVFLSLVALLTVIANGISLFAIYKDPLKCFRNPFAVFITGILVSDFLTGFAVEPAFVASYTLWMVEVDIESYAKVIRSCQILSAVTINTSFLTVLALAVIQLMALSCPSCYNRCVTSPLAILGIIVIWIYAILFALLPEMSSKVDMELYFTIDLILHTTLISVILVIIYIIIYFMFKRAMRRHQIATSHGNDGEEDLGEDQRQNRGDVPVEKIEKDFLIGSFIVIVVLMATVWPFSISLYIWLFRPYGSDDTFMRDYIALIFSDDILFLKFLLDPLIFVWRLPKYRKAIRMVLAPARVRLTNLFSRGSLPSASYHRQEGEDSGEDHLILPDREWNADITTGVLEIRENEA